MTARLFSQLPFFSAVLICRRTVAMTALNAARAPPVYVFAFMLFVLSSPRPYGDFDARVAPVKTLPACSFRSGRGNRVLSFSENFFCVEGIRDLLQARLVHVQQCNVLAHPVRGRTQAVRPAP